MLTCSECHVSLNLSEEQEQRLRESHRSFYCINGHVQYFPEKTDTDKLRDRVAELIGDREYWRERAETAEKRLVHFERRYCGLQGWVAKLQRRILVATS